MAYSKPVLCSSSFVPTTGWKYDVFLSFRGEDTRYNFVDHLHVALKQSGICVFKDDEELKLGKAISPELLKAIEESKFAVVVISRNYANSSWCLAELAKIMEWHNRNVLKVIPVFYHVNPSDIRGQKNEVAVFFQQHEVQFREEMDKVNEWREALTAAANLSGKHISDAFKVGESNYIREIVEEILHDIQPCDVDGDLVGIDFHIDALISKLEMEEKDEVRIIGIYGMGGIGKTTIAKALFSKLKYMFESSSFLHDVRENSFCKRDICALQEKVLREILPINHNFSVQDPKNGANIIRARCMHKKVLIVLDDVDNGKQLEFLANAHDWFGPGSRIIITTRNEQLLSDANEKYKPDCLLMHEALEFFSRHAFKRNSPPEGYEELSRRAIQCAGYLPLAVKVLGSFFHGKKASVWESYFNRLAKAQHADIFETLKLSFDGLEVFEKNLFLDIACFFKGKYLKDVTKVFESCGFDPQIGISVLIEKSLITLSNDELGMHDLIQEMGWQIVRESFPNSRLWKLEDICDSLKDNQKLKAIEAIVVSYKQYDVDKYEENVSFSANVFEGMKNLRLLDIRGRFTSGEPTVLPDNLQWLSWSECPFSSLQVTQMSKLVGLELSSGNIKQFWNGQKIMPSLKILILHQLDCLTTLPDVSVAPNIEKLLLYRCKNLVEVHESLGSHKRIYRLIIKCCERLKHLPSRFEMASLKFLRVNKCSSLERFPDVSPCMEKLSFISLDSCSSIQELPDSFGYLSSLVYLSLRRYRGDRMSTIPICKEEHGCEEESFVEDDTKAFEHQPKSISLHTLANLCSLRILNLSCRPIESEVFLKNLQAFSYLENLDLSGNNNLTELPTSISQLSHLKRLILNECHQLQVLHGLPPRIQELEANNCFSLEKIKEVLSTEYDSWNRISFINCQKLLENEDTERYLDKTLQQSFLKRCAVGDGPLTIVIPGNKIPCWFREQPGYLISLMMPPKHNNTQIIGIVVCGVFPGEWHGPPFGFDITVKFEKDGKSIIQKEEVDSCVINNNVSDQNGNTWIGYRPCSSIRGLQCQDWSGGGALLISLHQEIGAKTVRCAALLMYKEEDSRESNQQIIKTYIGRPWLTKRERQKSIHLMPPHLRPPKSSRIRNSPRKGNFIE